MDSCLEKGAWKKGFDHCSSHKDSIKSPFNPIVSTINSTNYSWIGISIPRAVTASDFTGNTELGVAAREMSSSSMDWLCWENLHWKPGFLHEAEIHDEMVTDCFLSRLFP